MSTLPNNLLATAELLASVKAPLGGAGLRRSVSTAYYALFSRMASLCARQLARSGAATETFRIMYRMLEHGAASTALLRQPEFASFLGDSFRRLQEAREWADYSVDSHPQAEAAARGIRFTRLEAEQFVALAKDAMFFIDALPSDAKQRLAVILIARKRR